MLAIAREEPSLVTEPIFWLGVSLLLVAVSLTAVLMAAVPAFRELARAARSAEKLFDTLSRELPPTLESIRLTGLEITDLTEDVSEGVQSAGRVVKQVDQSIVGVAQQAKRAQSTTRSVWVGVKAAWKTFSKTKPQRRPPERFSSKIKRPFDSALNAPPETNESWQDLKHYNADLEVTRSEGIARQARNYPETQRDIEAELTHNPQIHGVTASTDPRQNVDH